MSHSLLPLISFTGGEWSPALDSRIDIENYRKSCRQLRNMLPMKQGGVSRRPGTEFIADGKYAGSSVISGGVSRLEKFQYAPGTTFVLEFCQYGIRFYSNGEQVEPYKPADWVSGTDYAAGAFVKYSGNTYYLYNGPLLNSTTNPSADTTHWFEQTAYEVPAPYSATNYTGTNYWEADVFVLQTKQINDVVYIVHPDFPVYKLIRYSDSNWVMQEVQFLTPPLLDQNVYDTTIAASATTGSVTLTATAPSWSSSHYYIPGNSVLESGVIYNCVVPHTSTTFSADLANGYWKSSTIFQSGHVDSYWQLAYNRSAAYVEYDLTANGTSSSLYLIGTGSIQTYGTWEADIALQSSYDNGVTWQVITTVTSRSDANFNLEVDDISGGTYRMVITNWASSTSTTTPRVVLTADNQFVYGLVKITAVATDYSATATVITPLYDTSATQYWSEGAWSDVRGYPRAITIFQERAWYASTENEPQRIWASQTDDLENFALVDQSQATYALAFDLNAPTRGPIQWLTAQTELFAGLAGAEWVINSGQTNSPISPTQINATEQTANGSAPHLPGLIIGNSCFFLQRRGTSFQQLLYSIYQTKYLSSDMQVLSQHLTAAGVKQFDYQQQFQGQSVLWAVCGDGSLVSLTYDMNQQVYGWAKHVTDTQDFGFISVQVIYGDNGQDDEVWVVVRRRSDAFRTSVERINPVDWQTVDSGHPDVARAFYADCGETFAGPSSNVIGPLAAYNAIGIGRDDLVASINGNIAVTGLVLEADRTVTIPNYSPADGDVVVVGLPYEWVVQPMRLDFDSYKGPLPGIKKAISKLYLRTLNSLGGNWATEQGDVKPIKWRPINSIPGSGLEFTPSVPVEKELDVGGLMQYEDDPIFYIEGSAPLPFTLLGITVKYDVGGTP